MRPTSSLFDSKLGKATRIFGLSFLGRLKRQGHFGKAKQNYGNGEEMWGYIAPKCEMIEQRCDEKFFGYLDLQRWALERITSSRPKKVF